MLPDSDMELERAWALRYLTRTRPRRRPRWPVPAEIDPPSTARSTTSSIAAVAGEAVREAREAVRGTLNTSDWLAYAAYGHPAAEPYMSCRLRRTLSSRRRRVALQAAAPGETYRFRATYGSLAPTDTRIGYTWSRMWSGWRPEGDYQRATSTRRCRSRYGPQATRCKARSTSRRPRR